MNELLQAAKAVIDCWDDPGEPAVMRVEKLRAAVERAEKQEAAGFDEWATTNWPYSENSYVSAKAAWTAAQQAERDRIKKIVITMGWPDAPELLQQIDSGEEDGKTV